jgi:hypothetical protein
VYRREATRTLMAENAIFVVMGHSEEEVKKFCLLQYFQPASSSFA